MFRQNPIDSMSAWWLSVKHKTLYLILFYTGMFLLAAFIGYSSYFFNQKNFVQHGNDGLSQYYSVYAYTGKYYRELIRGFLSFDFTIPLYEFKMGLGDDIFTSMMWCGFFNPVVILISMLTPMAHTEFAYFLIVFAQMYLSGIAFLCYSRYMKKGSAATLCASVAYVFSGFMFYYAARHPHLVTPMIFLPLLLLGIEKILRNEPPYFFILVVFFALTTSYYLFYMLTIIMLAYALLRFFDLFPQDRLRNFGSAVFRCARGYLIGALLSCIIVFPGVLAFLGSGRNSEVVNNDLLFWPSSSIIRNFLYLFAPSAWGRACLLPICLLSTVLLFSLKNRGRTLKIAAVLSLVGLVVPAVGYFFNGFAYTADRWAFLVPFVFSYILAEMFPDLLSPDTVKRRLLVAAPLVFLCCVILVHNLTPFKINTYTMFMFGMTVLIAMLLLNKKNNGRLLYVKKMTICAIVMVLAAFNGVFFNSNNFANYVNNMFAKNGASFQTIHSSPAAAMSAVKDDSFYRVDSTIGSVTDANLLFSTYGISEYFSIMNPVVPMAMIQLEKIIGTNHSFEYHGFDQRAALNTLANVKYFAVQKGKEGYAPYGYEKITETRVMENDYAIFENKYALPFGYTYESYVLQSDYDNMTALEKQETALQSVALELLVDGYVRNNDLLFESREIPYEMIMDGVEWNNGILIVKKDNAIMTIQYQPDTNEETYIRFSNLNASISKQEMIVPIVKYGNGIQKVFRSMSNFAPMYCGIHDYMVNISSRGDELSSVTVVWPKKGAFQLDGIQILSQSMDQYANKIDRLKSDVMDNLKIDVNSISGTIEVDSNKILCLSIPYSSGWTAYVNDERTPILKGNDMYCVIPLRAGLHSVELRYLTPGLKAGAALCLTGLLLLGALVIYTKKSYQR